MFQWKRDQAHHFLRGSLHGHTTRSDGYRDLPETVEIYRGMGYDFYSVTDHRKYYRAPLEQEGMILLPGIECDGMIDGHSCHHIVGLGGGTLAHDAPLESRHTIYLEGGMAHDAPIASRRLPDNAAAQGLLDEIKSNGLLPLLAHPNWSRVTHENMLALDGLWGIEVYNSCADVNNLTGDSTTQWDVLLAAGRRLYCVAVDDQHRPEHFGRGWVMVHAAERTAQALLDSLAHGRFYASTGVDIKSLYTDGDKLVVETSPCKAIHMYSGKLTKYQPFVTSPNGSVTRAVFDIPPADARYIRVQATDGAGHFAWSQPLYLS